MQIGTSGPQGKDMKRSSSRLSRSKVKVVGGCSLRWRPRGGVILKPLGRVCFLYYNLLLVTHSTVLCVINLLLSQMKVCTVIVSVNISKVK